MRGRKPTPTVLKLLRGNPGKRRINAEEPSCAPAPLEPPAWLEGEARTKWTEMAPQLLDAGLLAQIDTDALAAYCLAYADWREALNQLKTYGKVVAAPSGYPMPSPWVAIEKQARADMARAQTEFGMTPSSRTRVHGKSASGKKQKRLERFLAHQAQTHKAG
jgi:P27 family predicted phage terminase small subunit